MNKPIIALNGGLGNQLFQWFFAHTVSADQSFRVDPLFRENEISLGVNGPNLEDLISRCPHIEKNSAGLVKEATPKKLLHLANHLWHRLHILHPLLTWLGYYRENPNSSVPQSPYIPIPMRYAYGYFQNGKVIEQMLDQVKVELVPIVAANLQVLRDKFELDTPYTVIHVRRYPTKGFKLSPIQFCNLDSSFFVDWAEKNSGEKIILLAEFEDQVVDIVQTLSPKLVLDSSKTSAWDVLAIMAGAEKCLGSNSSLSWWGARLCSIFGGETWLPANWSYWNNVDTKAFHFPGCKLTNSKWDISGFEE